MIKILVVEDDPMVGKLHEVYINQLDGFASSKSISIETLMKIARQMQARENAQE